MIRIAFSNICSAFSQQAIGTKVIGDHTKAIEVINKAIENGSFQENGQAFLVVEDLIPFVRSGDAPKSTRIEDYHLAMYRGEVKKFLLGHLADDVKVTFCAIVVYTKDAYLKDPDVIGDEVAGIPRDEPEYQRVLQTECTHVLVTVLASGGPKPTVSPHRFVMNLAGGNNDYKDMSGDDLRKKALEVKVNYETAWATVADMIYRADVLKLTVDLKGAGRVESGPVQFNDDWPGIFLRGDAAGPFGMMLHLYLTQDLGKDLLIKHQLLGFSKLLRGSEVKSG